MTWLGLSMVLSLHTDMHSNSRCSAAELCDGRLDAQVGVFVSDTRVRASRWGWGTPPHATEVVPAMRSEMELDSIFVKVLSPLLRCSSFAP